MSLLAEFLERFYSPRHFPETIWARARHERIATPGGESSRRPPTGREKRPRRDAKSVEEMEFWANGADAVREDQTRTVRGKTKSIVEVTRGNRRLMRFADGSIEVADEPRRARRGGSHLPNDFSRHFDRRLIRQFFASISLEAVGEREVAGRRCVTIRAVPQPGDGIWPHWLPTDADEYEFAADLEFPSLLSIRASSEGETFETFEVVQVAFNGEIDESVFDLQPLPGKETREAEPVVQRMSLAAAMAKVPFAVLLPRPASEFGDPQVHYEPLRNKRPGSLAFFYHGGPKSLWFHLRATLNPELHDHYEWEEVDFAGRRFELSDPKVEGGSSILLFEQQGTWVEITSDLPRDELLKLAASFEPAAP